MFVMYALVVWVSTSWMGRVDMSQKILNPSPHFFILCYMLHERTVDLLNFHAGEGIVYFNLFNSFTMSADGPFLITCTVCVFFNFKCR